VPEPLRGAEVGTFAHDTVTRRMPAIARRVVAENRFAPEIVAALEDLLRELPRGLIRPLRDTWAPDAALWAGYVAPYTGMSWLDAPWFFAETYLFRRILEATGYFGAGPGGGVDPYALQKAAGLELAYADRGPQTVDRRPWTEDQGFETRTPTASAPDGLRPTVYGLQSVIHASLWGNQADLSLWPAE
jgi:hypothetical protein